MNNNNQKEKISSQEDLFYTIEDIQEKTSFYLQKLFEYFQEENNNEI